MRIHTRGRSGVTLIELLIVTGIIAVLSSVAIPRAARIIDRINVDGATRHAATVFVSARHAAIANSRFSAVRINEGTATITAVVGTDTVVSRNLGEMFGVTIRATRDSMAYSPVGLGYGAANLRLIIRRGQAADTLFTSRVGRVRR